MRRNDMPVLKTLDAAGICATLLLVFVHFGDFFSGDDVGLATLSLPGRLQRGQGIFAHVGLHPVALYAALASLLIFLTLLWFLPRRGQAGEVFGLAIGLGAIARFWVDCYRMETIFEIATPFGLDPDQVVMVVVMLAAAAFWLKWPTKKQENAHAL
jgi:prolipoprotein diacylglyceryltransferase